MKTKHTKGPWVGKNEQGKYMMDQPWGVTHDDDHNTCCAPITAGKRVVALVVNDDTKRPLKMHHDEMTANARLIAAAPELLEALESIEMRLDAYNEADRDMPCDSVFVCLETARAAIRKALGEEK